MTNARQREGSWVRFRIDSVSYALDVHRVREVVAPLETVPLPAAPQAVVGMAEYRGRVVPVVDARVRYGKHTHEPGSRASWLVVDVGGHDIALVADAVLDVFSAPADEAGTVDGESRGSHADVSAVARHDGALVLVLATEALRELTAPVAVRRSPQ